MKALQFSMPTNAQLKKDVSRIVGVFAVAFIGSLSLTSDPGSTSVWHAAVLAGFTAAYQAIENIFTTL